MGLAALGLIAFLYAASFSTAQPRPELQNAKPELGQGRRNFVTNCASCHGLDGRGGEHAPDIATNPDVRQLTDAKLFEIVEDGIPASGMPSFSSLGKTGIQDVVGYLRVLEGIRPAQAVPGNAARGRVLFFGKGGCSKCHMIKGRGGFLGPDLSNYAASHSPEQIRDAIIDPNKNLNLQEDAVTVMTRGGRKYTGIARNEDDFSLQLQTPDGAFHLFMKSDLVSVHHAGRSFMPSDYGEKLSPQQLDDLVNFLLEAGESTPPAH